MRRFASAALLAVSCAFLSFATAERAAADVLINVNKSTQRLTVTVDGTPRYAWAISSGLGGGPPSGSYRPERLERKWFSRKYDWSPMPHAIFFYHGFAIHGTNYVSRLGRPASHGCVRLHPTHAATLFDLVQRHGKSNTRIVVGNSSMVAHR